MASIFDRYGIKEVADVTFYDLGADEKPVLYLDTLKVSTTEQTAENTSARGGKGNPELIMWDYGKEITVTLEDALFSAKSMAMMYGSAILEPTSTAKKEIRRTVYKDAVSSDKTKVTINDVVYTCKSATPFEDNENWVDVVFETEDAMTIEISADKFPGTYKVVGDTYARSETTGEDEFFQFIINKAKVLSEVTLTMEAEGDPSTFSMNLKVLRPGNGKPMMELVKYNLPTA